MKKIIISLSLFLILIISVFLYINRFSFITSIKIDGYAIDGKTLTSNLVNGLKQDSHKVNIESVGFNDNVYKSGNNYYFGEEKKKNIDIKYPIISKDTLSLFIVSDNGLLIDEKFNTFESLSNIIIVNGQLYNGSNFVLLDNDKYYFLVLENGIYVNLTPMYVIGIDSKINIIENSFLSFDENVIRFYSLENDELIFHESAYIMESTKIENGNFRGTYTDFLKKIGKYREINEIIEEDINGKIINGNNENSTSSNKNDNQDITYRQENYDYLWSGKEYIKPEVSISNTQANTYSFVGDLSIYDPSLVIIKSPTFTFKENGKVFLRKTFNADGKILVEGLKPETTYEVEGSYIYYNEKGQKIQKTFYLKNINTLGVDKIGNIIIDYSDIFSTSDSFTISNLHFKNDSNDDALNGIKKIKIKYGDLDTQLSSRNVRQLASLLSIDFQSSNVLKSNTLYDGEIIIYDTADNVMKIENANFSFVTKKTLPLASIIVQNGKNFTTASLNFDINNVDNVNVLKYQYVVFDSDGKEIIQEVITESTKKRDINNLDSGKKYYIMLYCDYIDDDGIKKENVRIATTEFLSYDVERLGKIFLDIKYDDTTDTTQRANIAYRNTDETFNILYDMLSENVMLKVINNYNNDVLYTRIYDKNLLRGMGSSFMLDNLVSNTEYRIEFEFKIVSGEKEVIINTDYGNKNVFTTIKQDPSFIIENLYIASGFIDFDAIIYDKDGAIVFEDDAQKRTVTLEVYDSNESKVYSKSLYLTNGNLSQDNPKVINRINIDNLDSDGRYLFKVTAKNYDNGKVSESNYEINHSRTFVLSGISGSFALDKLIKSSYYDVLNGSADGKNLFDITNRSRWKSSGDSSTTQMLTLDVDNNKVEIGAKNGGRRYNYYIPEIYQKNSLSTVTVSFDVKRLEGTSTTFCLINGASGTCSNNSNARNITNVTSEYKHVDITFNGVNSDGYISFYIGETVNKNLTTKFSISNLEIVIGREENANYESFNDDGNYVGVFNLLVDEPANINEISRQIIENSSIEPDMINDSDYDVYIRIKCSGENCSGNDVIYEEKINYESFPYMENIEINHIIGDASYTGYLSIYSVKNDLNRTYDISTINFSSDSEIRTISTSNQLFNMHPNGYYIVTSDIDLRGVCKSYSGTFQGSIDFKGHKLYVDNCSTYVIQTLGGSGKVNNLDVHYYLDGPKASISSFGGLFSSLNGRLSNIMVTLESTIDQIQNDFALIAGSNFGTIENFVIKSKTSLIGHKEFSLGVRTNYGVIKNGYIYGENILSIYSSNTNTSDAYQKNVGAVASTSQAGSIIKNVYSLVDIEINENPTAKDKFVGNIVGQASNATIKNILTFKVEDNTTRDKTKDIMIASASNITLSDLYYVSSNNYANTYSKHIMAKSFNDPLFLDNVLNEEGAFDTSEAFKLKIFPHIIWPDVMPVQEYLIIPSEYTENQLSLISVDEINYLDNDSNYLAKVLLTFHNENLVKITGLQIAGIDNIQIIDQAHNRNSKTTLLYALIGYPNTYKSKYKLEKIMAGSYAVDVDENIDMDLYYPIENLQDIATNLSKHENFRLIKDIDCSTSACPTTNLGTIKGKIDGDNHVIRNFETNGCYINTLNGTLKNVTFENYKVLGNKNVQGLICTMKNATIDNVFLINEELTIGTTSSDKNVYVGGIAAKAEQSLIENSGINGIKLHNSTLGSAEIWYGSFVGNASYLSVENSFARNISFKMIKDVNSASSGSASNNNSRGLGGIVGAMSYGNISNVYATGKMETDMGIIGGIAGINSNGYIDSVMANVNILASQDEVGGINGRSISNTNPKRENAITKSITIGSISVLLETPNYFGRTSGSDISMNGNYAWDKQQINSKTYNNSDGEYLLSTSDLSNSNIYESRVGFNPKFFALHSDFVPGYMPYLMSKDGNILKEQGYGTNGSVEDRWIHYVESLSLISSEFNYHYTEGMEDVVDKEYYAEYADATIVLNNPDYYTVNNIDITGMEISNLRTVTNQEGITTLTFNAVPIRYLDSYNLNKIEYFTESNNEAIYPSIVINLKFYGRLANATDWNRLVKGSLENYIVVNDIDFYDVDSYNYSISFNNLIGIVQDGRMPTIKNIGTHDNPLYFSNAGDSLIDTVVSDIKNVTFENIYIYNRATSGNYTGIIKFLNGSGNNLSFNNIEVLAPKTSYVGLICYNQSSDLRNVIVNNTNISGVSFVGGLIGRSMSRNVTNVKLNNVTIKATGDYVGGLLGYEAWDSKIHTFQITATSINVINTANRTYIGGIFGYGTGNVVSISDSYVEGYNRVGGISGQDGNSSSQYNFVNNVTVVGRGSYVGGATGINTTRYYTYVTDTIVHCRSSLTGNCSTSYVGGIAGGVSSYTILYSGVKNTNIIGGTAVGGIKGYLSGYSYIYGNYVKDTAVIGNSSVGGIAGSISGHSNYIYLNTSNATVEAKKANAGGIVGYVNNTNTSTTNSNYRTYVYRNIVANSIVTAPSYSGGLIGRVNKELYSGQYYSNVISANVQCTNDDCLAGYVIGTTDEYSSGVAKLKIYENSTLKIGSNEVTTLINDFNAIDYLRSPNVMISRDKLEDFNMYKNTLSFSTSYYEASTDCFPRVKSINNSYGNYKVDFELPELITTRSLGKKASMFHLMPEVNVYPVDVDKINIEFSFVDENTYFEINGRTYTINQKTFTFYYNYIDDFTITLKDGINEHLITVSHESLKNKIIIDGDNYYILDDNGEVISNVNINYNAEKMNSNKNYSLMKIDVKMIEEEKIKGVNAYDGKILLDNGNIYDINKDQVILNYVDNLTMVETKPLYEYKYANQSIKTFETYSTVDDKYISKRIIVNNGQLEILSNELNEKTSNILTDYYNGKNYLIYLDDNSSLHSVKEAIVYPNNFRNYDIEFISFDKDNDSHLIFVKYKNNNYVLFDYLNGEIKAEKNDYIPSLFEYAKNYFSESLNINNTVYEDAKKELQIIIDNEKESNANNSYESSDYSVVYNPISQTYDIYEIPSNVSSRKNLANIVDNISLSKELANNNLNSSYNLSVGERYFNMPVLIIISFMLLMIAFATFVLWKNIHKIEK